MTAARSDLMALANEISIAGFLRIEGGRLLNGEEKSLVVSALRQAASQPDRDAMQTLQRFADLFRSGAHGCDMGCDAAKSLALAIDSLLSGAGTKSDGVSCHTRRLDDLGSVQDGLKMSTDGQRTDTLDMSSSERRDVNPDVTAGETAPSPSDTPIADSSEDITLLPVADSAGLKNRTAQSEQGSRGVDLTPQGVAASTFSADSSEDWRDDPSADERWNAGLDYAMERFCSVLAVDPKDVRWDAATEELDGDVRAVIYNILRIKFGDNFDPTAALSAPVGEPPLTASALADALECFWNAAVGAAHNAQQGVAEAGNMAEGFAAIARRLKEHAATSSAQSAEKFGRAIYDVSNKWIAPNFPPDWKPRPFEELETQERDLHLDYGKAVLSLLRGG